MKNERPIDFEDLDAIDAEAPQPVNDDADDEPRSGPATKTTGAVGLLDVLGHWSREGPLVHESTGIAVLDDLTSGGPVFGTRWYIAGAPDACKTAILVQWTHLWASRKIVVGVLAVDEEASDLVTRIAQRHGFSRQDCERREPDIMDRLNEDLARDDLTDFIRIYDDAWTIETASTDLASYAETLPGNPRLAFVVDSIQTASCDASRFAAKLLGPRETVTANVTALRAVGSRYRAITAATCEMNRNAYRSVIAAEQSNDIAAGAESRAIEFSARVYLTLRSVKGNGDLVEVRVVKNKHGRSYPSSDEALFHLSIDRARQILTEAPKPDDTPEEDEHTLNLAEVEAHAITVLQVIVDKPGLGNEKLEIAVRATGHKIGRLPLAAAVQRLLDTKRAEDQTVTRGKVIDHHYFASGHTEIEL